MNRIIKCIPNTITSGNLFCGAIATYYASIAEMRTAMLFILLGAVCDFLDGTSARVLKAYSPLGVQLDSLADMISFGLAPSMAMFTLMGKQQIAYIAFLLAVFSALRLAKFNIDETQKTEFHGLPTPAMSLFMFSYACTVTMYSLQVPEWVNVILVVVFALLMVSPFVMFSLKFKNLSIKDNLIRFIFILFAIIMLALLKEAAFAVIIIGYILTSLTIDVFESFRK